MARRFVGFLAAFGLSKSLVVVAPIVAAMSLPLSAYGHLEWSLALATTLAPVVVLGLTAAILFFLLHKDRPVPA